MYHLDQLAMKMAEFNRGNPNQIQHFSKVYAYATWIAKGEGLSEELTEQIGATAILHDIGIKIALEKYQTSAGPYQEKEGAPAAKAMLEELGEYAPEVIERISYIVGHHHTYTNIDGIDYQIVVEADFLVNFQEGNQPAEVMPSVFEKIFRTETGKELLRRMYDFKED